MEHLNAHKIVREVLGNRVKKDNVKLQKYLWEALVFILLVGVILKGRLESANCN